MKRDSRQQPLFRVSQFLPNPYPAGSIYDVLARYGGFLFRRSDFPEAPAELGGEIGWCPVQMSALEVLRQKHGWSDREAVRRATYDMQVKACLGLGIEMRGPSQTAICRHRKLMQGLGLDRVYLERLRDLLEVLELVGDDEPVLIDSVPVSGAGQQLDTWNLLAGATRRGLRELAKVRRRPIAEVAEELGLSVYLSRSIKGRFEVDWESEDSRREFLARLVQDARLVVEQIRAPQREPRQGDTAEQGHEHSDNDDDDGAGAGDAAEVIDSIIEHDVELNDDGEVAGIRRKAAGDRIISVTDPDMRHGRKSASKLITGFKAQVVASVMYGFIVMVRVIKANAHDGADLPSIAEELEERGLRPDWWGGDHAYGTIDNHGYFASADRGDLVARMARPVNGGRFTKDDFDYSFDNRTLRCPGGHRLDKWRWVKRRGRRGLQYEFPSQTCGRCPKREQCVKPGANADTGRSVFVVEAEERLIRDHLVERQTRGFKDRLAQRCMVERVIAGFAQCGGKSARRHGQQQVEFDSNMSAFAYNLRRLGSLMRADQTPGLRLDAALRRFLRDVRTILTALVACVRPLAA